MKLLLRRSQRAGGMLGGKVLFVLDARVDLSSDERALVQKYNLGKLNIYDSEARKKNTEAAYGHFDDAATAPDYSASSAGRSLWNNARGLARSAMMALSLRVTVDGLISGQHIECETGQDICTTPTQREQLEQYATIVLSEFPPDLRKQILTIHDGRNRTPHAEWARIQKTPIYKSIISAISTMKGLTDQMKGACMSLVTSRSEPPPFYLPG